MQWDGLVCLVTGASSGFGYETAKAIAERGAEVIGVARREPKLKELVEELGGAPHSYIAADLSTLEGVRSMILQLQDRTDHIDILINNAGVASTGPIEDSTSEEIDRVIRTNLMAPIWTTRESLSLLKAAPHGSHTPLIVNIASMAGRLPLPRSADYTAAKFGLVGFTESVSYELAEKKIRTMVVNPGLADTEGFPMDKIRANPLLGWTVMDASRVVAAIIKGIEWNYSEVRVQWWMHPLYHASVLMGPVRRLASGALRSVMKDSGF